MSQITTKESERARVHERIRAGKCLIPECENNYHSRGLCPKHYSLFVRELKSRDDEKKVEFEADAIKQGLILEAHAVSGIKDPSPFEECGQ